MPMVKVEQATLGNLSFWRGFITYPIPVLKENEISKIVALVPSEVGFHASTENDDGSVVYEFSTLLFSVVNDYHNTKEWAEEEADRLITALDVLAQYEPVFEAATPEENSEHVRSFFRECEAAGVPFHLNSWIAIKLLDEQFISETDWDTMYLLEIAASCFEADWLKAFLAGA